MRKIFKSVLFIRAIGWMFTHAGFLMPGRRLGETDNWMAVKHPKPAYPVHILLIPKKPIRDWLTFPVDDRSLYGEFVQLSQRLIREADLASKNYRLIINGGENQSTPQLHVHLISGDPIGYSPLRSKNMDDTLDIIKKRRSIRKFTDQPVEKETLSLLLEAAMAAPSAMNARPWEFVVITDKGTMDQFRQALLFGKMNAPAAICVLGSHRMQKGKAGDKFWVQDCSAATENILLAATALGLGSVWVGIHPVTLFQRQVSRILNLPDGVTPLNLIYIGYPAEEKVARSQYEEDRVHWGPFPKNKNGKGQTIDNEVPENGEGTDGA